MAASELKNRLEYLVSYSSQLVFVCTDKLKQQSQVVESFLGQQSEQAELALVTANELTPLVSYRETLFRQLIGQTQDANFALPLNQLLAQLNQHSGPVLITIFQAEKLPEKLLKEIWELVLQSQFANNKQQLNVLLMGESNWAEEAKMSLSSTSKSKPILLNSQSHLSNLQNNTSGDLDQLIQHKRQKLVERMPAREYDDNPSAPIYKKWWMRVLLSCFFLSVFAGILLAQYPETLINLNNFISAQALSIDKIPTSLASSEEATPTQPQEKTMLSLVHENEVAVQNLLVTDWQTAVNSIEEKAKKAPSSSNATGLQSIQATSTDKPLEISKKLAPQATLIEATFVEIDDGLAPQAIHEKSRDVLDYAIKDTPFAEDIVIVNSANPESVKTDGLAFTPDILMDIPKETFVIQVAAMANLSVLQEYIKDEKLEEQLWLYETQRYGGSWYVLLKNQYFPNISEARAHITALPDTMLRNTPFAKKIEQVQKEVLTIAKDS